jgi:nucleotide-binding universal stress UspA family protein
MYQKILVTLDATPTDQVILAHVKQLAKLCKSRLALLHVADGWAAKTLGADAVSPEIDEDQAYLATVRAELEADGIATTTHLAYGEPVAEIVRWVDQEGCDLIAMSTHGHGLINDLIRGTTANRVQHRVSVPVLLLRAPA